MGCRDVQEDDLVCAILIVSAGQLPGNPGISDLFELDSFYNATARHSQITVQTGNNPPG
jgi:hypothetical protein